MKTPRPRPHCLSSCQSAGLQGRKTDLAALREDKASPGSGGQGWGGGPHVKAPGTAFSAKQMRRVCTPPGPRGLSGQSHIKSEGTQVSLQCPGP